MRKNRGVWTRLCGSLLALALLVTAFGMWTTAVADDPIKIACVGDSVTAGALASSGQYSYPSQLQKMLGSGYTVRNFGVNGTTLMSQGDYPYSSTAQYTQSQTFLPDIVLLMLGSNDSKTSNWQHADNFESELRAMITVYQNLESQPTVIVATSPTAFSTIYDIQDTNITEIAKIQRKVAREMGCPLIEINVQTKNLGDLFEDGVHPGDDGYAVLADLMRTGVLSLAVPTVENFTAAGRTAKIDNANGTITLSVPEGTDLAALDAVLTLPSGAVAAPENVTDFSAPVTYAVSSPDGSVSKDFTVTVTYGDEDTGVDKTTLQAAIDEFRSLNATIHTAASWFPAEMAAQAAVAVMEDEAATQSAVDSAKNRLATAVAGLQPADISFSTEDLVYYTGFETGANCAFITEDVSCDVDGAKFTAGWGGRLLVTSHAQTGGYAAKLSGWGRVCLDLPLEAGTTYVISGQYCNKNAKSAEMLIHLKPTGSTQDSALMIDGETLTTISSMGVYRPFSVEITTPTNYTGGYLMFKWMDASESGVFIDNLCVAAKASDTARAALEAVVAEAEALEETAYTPDSWDVLEAALAAAETAVTQAEVEKATAAIREAIDTLVPTAPDYTAGDVNDDGAVDSKDARLVLQFTVDLAELDDTQKLAADLNGDNTIDSKDARAILQASVSA